MTDLPGKKRKAANSFLSRSVNLDSFLVFRSLVIIGIVLMGIGGFISIFYHGQLVNCATSLVPCPDYTVWVNNGILILGIGIAIIFLGIAVAVLRPRPSPL